MSASGTELRHLVLPVETWDPAKEAPDQPFVYVDLSSVDRQTKRIVAPQTLAGAQAPSRAKQLLETGDVLVSTVRPNLNAVAVVPDELDGATGSTGFCVLRVVPAELDDRYLYHWTRSPSFIASMVRRATGASYPAVSDRIIKESRIPLPPLPEQRRIAAILDKADAVCRKRQQTLDLADQFLRSAFLDLFGDPVTNPKGWDLIPLEETADIVTGFAFSSGGFAGSGEGIALCRGINIGIGCINWKDRVDWPLPLDEGTERFRIEAGDILLAMDRPWIGAGLKAAIAKDGDVPALLVQRVARIRLAEKAMRDLVIAQINHAHFARHCNPTETTIPHISPRDLKTFPVIRPPLDLQRRYSSVVASVEQQEVDQREHMVQLDALFSSVQQSAFRGEL